MSGSREQMLRLLEQAKATVRARIPDMPSGRHGPRRPRHTHEDKDKEKDEKEATPAPTEVGGTANTVVNKVDAKAQTMEFLHLYYQIFRRFVLDPTKFKLPLEGLDSSARRVLHLLAERCNLDHQSGGSGDERAIMIEKGPLFYQHQDAYQTVDLERIAQEVNSKSSKFELKRATRLKDEEMTSGVIGSYDEEAYRKVQRYQRSTDEYRHAVDMGYSQEELQRAEKGEASASETADTPLPLTSSGKRLEELLSRTAADLGDDADSAAQDVVGRDRLKGTPSPQPPHGGAGGSGQAATTATTTSDHSRDAAATPATQTTATASTPQKTTAHEEVCRGCWTSVPLRSALRDWRCSKFCAQCGKNTIWMLRPVTEPAASTAAASADTASRNADDAHADAQGESDTTHDADEGPTAGSRKRHRDGDDDAVMSVSSDEEEADARSDDGGEEPLLVEDVVEMANGNDMEAADVNWLRHFCGLHASRLHEHVAFCIDLHDLLELPLFQRPARRAQREQRKALRLRAKQARTEAGPTSGESETPELVPAPRYVVVRESKVVHAGLASLLDKVLASAFVLLTGEDASSPQAVPLEDAQRHVALALPNASVYGSEALAIVQLRPRTSQEAYAVHTDALAALEKEFGSRHVHALTDLEAAIKEAE